LKFSGIPVNGIQLDDYQRQQQNPGNGVFHLFLLVRVKIYRQS